MKLEIKHLAPYLPYGLKVQLFQKNCLAQIFSLNTVRFRGQLQIKTIYGIYGDMYYKPVLRPLSDLTKEIEHNGKIVIPSVQLEIHSSRENVKTIPKEFKSVKEGNVKFKTRGFFNYTFLNYSQTNQLFQYHFDVFNLIENGLAIDINSIENVSV